MKNENTTQSLMNSNANSNSQLITKLFAVAALTTMWAPQQARAQAVASRDTSGSTVAVNVQAPADAPETPRAQPKSKLDPPTYFLLDAGYSDYNLSGSRNKFRQYATLPSGLFLKELTYVPMMEDPGQRIYTSLKGIGGTDYRGDSSMLFNYGGTQLTGFFSNSSFFEDTPAPVGASDRHSAGFNIRQALTRSFSLAFRFKNDIQQDRYESPNPGYNQNTQYEDAVASGKVGKGFLKLSTANLHFTDKTGTLLSSDVQTLSGSYLWNVSDAIDLEAAYSHASIGQQGMQGSHIETFGLNGDVSIGSGTDISLAMQNRHVSMPNVQNAYVRRQGIESITLSQHYKTWRGTIAMRLQDDERVTSTQTYVDVPKWSTVEGRLSGRVFGGLRATVRGYTQALIEQPTFNTSDPTNLYWTARDLVEGRLEGGHDDLNYYAVYLYKADRNADRATEVNTTQLTAGATYQFSPTVNLFGEFHHESWSGQADITGYPSIGNFLPEVSTGILQLTYNPDKRAYLSLTYTGFGSRNNNPLLLPDGNTRGTFVTINGRYRFNRGYELGFMVAPWTYRDNVVSAMNYNATVLMITGSTRF